MQQLKTDSDNWQDIEGSLTRVFNSKDQWDLLNTKSQVHMNDKLEMPMILRLRFHNRPGDVDVVDEVKSLYEEVSIKRIQEQSGMDLFEESYLSFHDGMAKAGLRIEFNGWELRVFETPIWYNK